MGGSTPRLAWIVGYYTMEHFFCASSARALSFLRYVAWQDESPLRLASTSSFVLVRFPPRRLSPILAFAHRHALFVLTLTVNNYRAKRRMNFQRRARTESLCCHDEATGERKWWISTGRYDRWLKTVLFGKGKCTSNGQTISSRSFNIDDTMLHLTERIFLIK